ncbi:MAG: DUF3413 domain-containing protein [Myxococcales bacterium]|nr:DUF3413 domain-containing protein [Myxococcales bacterium]
MSLTASSFRSTLRLSLWVLLLEVLLAAIISVRFWGAVSPVGPLEWVFLPLSALAHWTTVGTALWLGCLPLMLVWPRSAAAAVLIPAALFTLLVTDTVVFRIYHFHIDPFFLLMLGGGGGAGFFDLSPRSVAVIVSCFGVMLVGQRVIFGAAARLAGRSRWPRAGATLAVALLGTILATHALHVWASATGERGVMQEGELLPGFRGLTANSWLRARGYSFPPRVAAHLDVAAHLEDGELAPAGRLRYPREPLRCTGAALPNGNTRPNILLVVIESLRADALRDPVMPATTAFAQHNLNFTQHFSSGNSTQPGLGGLLYGIPATYWHSIANADGAGGPALVQATQALGYRFGAFSSRDTLQRLRFDRYFFSKVPASRLVLRENEGRTTDTDIASVGQLARFWSAGAAPALALLFLDSTHHRYAFPADYNARYTPSAPAEITAFDADTDPTPYYNQYLNSAGFVDTQVARVLADLEAQHLLEDTIVVLTGDHGESFNERRVNDWGHGLDFGALQTNVPLVVHWPGQAAAEWAHVTQHVDIAATLLRDALGCENPLLDYTTGIGIFDTTPRIARVVAGYVGYGIVTRSEIVSSIGGFVHITDRELNPKWTVDDAEGFAKGVGEMNAFYR